MPASQIGVVGAMRGKPILTVTDEASSADIKGIINFVIRDNRVRFEIDEAAAVADGLVISLEAAEPRRLRLSGQSVKERGDATPLETDPDHRTDHGDCVPGHRHRHGALRRSSNAAQRRGETEVQAQTLAATVPAALSFSDRQAAQEYLNAIRANPDIQQAAVIRATNGRLFASWAAAGVTVVAATRTTACRSRPPCCHCGRRAGRRADRHGSICRASPSRWPNGCSATG